MKTYAPKGLHGAQLRALMDDLHASQADICKYLQIGERTLRRWLADDSAPFAVLAALWHETPRGREASALDVGNEVVIQRGLAAAIGDAHAKQSARLARVLRIADTGAANDPLCDGPPVTYCGPPNSSKCLPVTLHQHQATPLAASSQA